jgi:hypothetical protein
MNFFYFSLRIGLIALLSVAFFVAAGQCPDCTPDETCISADGFPALCPLIPDDATAGEYYEEQLTFFMPALITDPETNIEATLISVTVTSVSGLPFGLEFTINDEDGVFYPSAGDGLGCATICGVPLLPGTYSVVISVNAIVSVFSFEASQSQSFTLTLVVVPGEGSASSFSYNNIAGCGQVDVTYNALISVPAPSVTTYSWDFGNGETAEGANPDPVSYNEAGDYTSMLTTTVSDHKLTEVSAISLSDNWSGDFDDLISEADVYFVVYDGSSAAVYTSATNDNVTSTAWTIPAITLSNPPYTVQFFDEDDITQDDNLGSASLSLTAGSNFFDVGNGTSGFFTITLETTTQITDSATITVFPIPTPVMSQSGNTFVVAADDVSTVVWYLNGNALSDSFESSLAFTEGGLYYAEVTNSFGCSAVSNSILYCAPVTIEYDAGAGELSVDDQYESYEWFYNGLPLDGASNSYLAASDPGNYMVEVTTDYGCTTESQVYVLELNVAETKTNSISAYPNPAENAITFKLSDSLVSGDIAVFDIVGKKMAVNVIQYNGSIITLEVTGYPAGVYFTRIGNNNIRWIRK